jgi:hypothetical protein
MRGPRIWRAFQDVQYRTMQTTLSFGCKLAVKLERTQYFLLAGLQYRETIHATAATSQQRMAATLGSEGINADHDKRLQLFKMGGVICAARHCQQNRNALPSHDELIDDGDTKG